jgi:hypothetical protein
MVRPTSAIAHFIPDDMLRELRLLALKLQRDEVVRLYILWRMWMVVPLAFIFLTVAGTCVVGVVKFTDVIYPSPMPFWLLLSTAVLLSVVFMGAFTTQLYVLLSWLERRATREHLLAPRTQPVEETQLLSSRTSRIRLSFVLVAAFVAIPFLMFVVAFPSAALATGGLGLVSMLALMIVTGDQPVANHFMRPPPAIFDWTTAWLSPLFSPTMAWLIACFVGGALISGVSVAAIAAYWLEPSLPPDIVRYPHSMPSLLFLPSVVQLLLACLIATVVMWIACIALQKLLVSSASVIALCGLLGATYALALGQLVPRMGWAYVIGFPAAAIAALAAVSHRRRKIALQPLPSEAIGEGSQ